MDRTHDAFVTLAEKLDGLDTSEELGGWLYRVAVNTCLMDLRRQKSWRTLFGALSGRPEPVDDMERRVRARRDASRFEAVLAELPAEQRSVMVLVYLDGASQTEAAELLGFSKGYVSKLHSRALASLRRRDWEIDGAADA
jgi:RNA polymerase sigma-70 factor (ECF subfamily)